MIIDFFCLIEMRKKRWDEANARIAETPLQECVHSRLLHYLPDSALVREGISGVAVPGYREFWDIPIYYYGVSRPVERLFTRGCQELGYLFHISMWWGLRGVAFSCLASKSWYDTSRQPTRETLRTTTTYHHKSSSFKRVFAESEHGPTGPMRA